MSTLFEGQKWFTQSEPNLNIAESQPDPTWTNLLKLAIQWNQSPAQFQFRYGTSIVLVRELEITTNRMADNSDILWRTSVGEVDETIRFKGLSKTAVYLVNLLSFVLIV